MAGKMPPQFMKGAGKAPSVPAKPGKPPMMMGGKKPMAPAMGKMAKGETDMGPATAFKKGGKVPMKGKC